MAMSLRRLERTVLDLIFPPRCIICRCYGEGYICSSCRDSIPLITPPVCDVCGQPVSVPGVCAGCLGSPLSIDGIRSAILFEGPGRNALHAFKYEGLTSLRESLGEFLSDAWKRFQVPGDVIVPIPLHSRRARQRGYNQSSLLAYELGRDSNLTVLDDLLVRVRATLPQVGLNADQRWGNVRGAFECRSVKRISGRAVLLVDDVCTTGATLSACAEALRPYEPVSIWALTLARA
jgi:ComF family protein